MPFVEWSPGASKVLANQIPADAVHQWSWLKYVFFGARACDEDFAFWAGKQDELLTATGLDARLLRPLAVYAWHSKAGGNPLNWLAFTHWSPEIAFGTAMIEARHWFNRVKLFAFLDGHEPAEPWPLERQFRGHEFVPLADFWQIMEEKLEMRNCLDGYADRLVEAPYSLVSIRKDGRRLATLEIAMSASGCHGPYVVQLRGPANWTVSPAIECLVEDWIEHHAGQRIVKPAAPKARAGLARLEGLLAEYWRSQSTGRCASRPVPVFARLEQSLERLAARLGLIGWPFSR